MPMLHMPLQAAQCAAEYIAQVTVDGQSRAPVGSVGKGSKCVERTPPVLTSALVNWWTEFEIGDLN